MIFVTAIQDLIMARENIFLYAAFLTIIINLCSAQEIVYHFDEEQLKGSIVGNVALDSGIRANLTAQENQQVRFAILGEGNPHATAFSIDQKTSAISVTKVLDRELICENDDLCILDLAVGVRSADGLRLYGIINVNVFLDDINDNPPEFPRNEIVLRISESVSIGRTISTEAATDKDTGRNSQLSFNLDTASNTFDLSVIGNRDGSNDLGIVVKKTLDREKQNFYQLRVTAIDGGSPKLSGTVLINVTITDVNDNFPVFSAETYTHDVKEDVDLGEVILTVTATDLDEGSNGNISYLFASSVPRNIRAIFSIDEKSGAISAFGPLDYEEDHVYTFRILAQDHGNDFKKADAIVVLNVIDVNDNRPQINVNFLSNISESGNVTDFVAHVSVIDEDTGDNGRIRCNIQHQNFELRKFQGNVFTIVLKKNLDYESVTRYNVTISCEDFGQPPLTQSANFFIFVKDENDHPPVFSRSMYYADVLENSIAGTVVTQVVATDADSGNNGKISYNLHLDAGPNFVIQESTGIMMVNGHLDREVTPEIHFRVLASDNGNPSRTATANVIVTLLDENDVMPRFAYRSYDVSVLENQPEDTIVASISASDQDAGRNGEILYSIVSGTDRSKAFKIDSSGTLKLARKLDRESRAQYNIKVMATDRGNVPKVNMVNVTINVHDVNDNKPNILYPNPFNNSIIVSYISTPNKVIGRVDATDPDAGRNAELRYHIHQGNKNNLFVMNADNGNLAVSRGMRLYDADSYKLVLSVSDNGNPVKTSWANLNVIVTISNDTTLDFLDDERSQQNLMIVVTLAVVTAVLSVAIIITICIIKRIDKGKHHYHTKCAEQKVIHAKRRESSSSTSKISRPDLCLDDDKKKKKEVSFSLDEEKENMMDSSSLTNVTNFSSFKHPQSSYMSSSSDHKTFEQIPQACSSLITSSTMSDDVKPLNQLSAQKLQNLYLLQLPQDKSFKDSQHEKSLLSSIKKPDDCNSETSADTTTSDSGRGGSEEDVNNRGHYPLGDTEEPRRYSGVEYRDNRFKALDKSADLRYSQTPRVPAGSNGYHRNISFSDDSINANNLHVNGDKQMNRFPSAKLSPIKTNYCADPQPCGRTPRFYTTTSASGLPQRDTITEMTPSSMGLRYSVADVDDGLCESMQGTRDEDDRTTTSGSYTINPDELCNEINELFFKDVIV